MSDKQTFLERLKKAPKSLAVVGIAVTGTSPYWLPILDHAANGALGPDIQKYAIPALAVLSLIGWAKPQPKLFP